VHTLAERKMAQKRSVDRRVNDWRLPEIQGDEDSCERTAWVAGNGASERLGI